MFLDEGWVVPERVETARNRAQEFQFWTKVLAEHKHLLLAKSSDHGNRRFRSLFNCCRVTTNGSCNKCREWFQSGDGFPVEGAFARAIDIQHTDYLTADA